MKGKLPYSMIFDKKTAKRSKTKEIKKKAKKYLKNQEICANFELETQFQAMQKTVVSIPKTYISI